MAATCRLGQVPTIVLCLLCWIFLLPFLVLAAIPLSIFLIWRSLVDILVFFVHRDWEPILSPDCTHAVNLRKAIQPAQVDVEVGNGGNYSNRVIARAGNFIGAIFFDEDVSIEIVRANFMTNIWNDTRFKRMKQIPRTCMGFSYWTAPVANFDISKHILESELQGEQTAERVFEHYVSEGFEHGRPLWKAVKFVAKSGYCKGKYGVCVIINHIMGDGFTVSQLLNRWCGQDERKDVHQIGALKPIRLTFTQIPLGVDAGCENDIFRMNVYDLQRIKKISKGNRCRFSEVLLFALYTAIRKYMAEAHKENDVKRLSVSLAIPWIYARRKSYFGNSATVVPYLLPLDKEIDLQTINKQLKTVVTLGIDRILFYMCHLSYIIPVPFLKLMQFNQIPAPIIISDFLQAVEPSYLQVLQNKFLIHGFYATLGLEVAPNAVAAGLFVSSCDKVCVGLMFKKKHIPDVASAQKIENYMIEKLDELYSALPSGTPDERKLLLPGPSYEEAQV